MFMSSSNLFKNIISKDKNLSENAIKELLKTKNKEGFEEICKKSEFIFPFVKEKIINNFVKIVNKDDLDTIFEFSKIYSYDFEDIIVKSWLKFANEDLTDRILELFEIGKDCQKAYCAKYFSVINDPLSLEYLEKQVFSDYEPLRINCARALKSFGQDEIINIVKKEIMSSDNEFDKIPLYQILAVWGNKENIKFILDNSFLSPYNGNIISNILDYNDFSELNNYLDYDSICKIFNVLIENYPENLELNTLIYYQIYDFIVYLNKNPNSYSINLLALAKNQFSEYEKNDIYIFDLDKDSKEELKKINNFLKTFEPDFSNLKTELYLNDSFRFETAIKVIDEYKLDFTVEELGKLINGSDASLKAKAVIAQTLKSLNKTDIIEKEKIQNIENENIKALILSLVG